MHKNKKTGYSLLTKAYIDARGAPGWTLFLIYFAFGSTLKSIGFDPLQSVFSTMFIYALPGQIVMANGVATSSSLLSISFITLLINIRLMPMAISIAPLLKKDNPSPLDYYLSAHFITVSGWINFIDNRFSLHSKDALHYFIYTGIIFWCFSLVGTLAGFYVVEHIPNEIFLSLLLIIPLFFLCVVAKHGFKDIYIAIAVYGGCALYIPFTFLSQEFALAYAGISGGTLAFLIRRLNT